MHEFFDGRRAGAAPVTEEKCRSLTLQFVIINERRLFLFLAHVLVAVALRSA